jgi:putative transposase
MLNFKSFHSAASVIAGIEFMHMIRKSQFTTLLDTVNIVSFNSNLPVPYE